MQEGVSIEGRWAFANWGVIPLNPTVYAEWLQGSRAEPDKFDRYEFKLLLADEFWESVYYAANFTFEQETGGERDQELAFSQAFSTTLIERELLGGIEMVLESTSVQGARSHPQVEFDIGPSLQWRPTERTFLDVVPLFGTTGDSPAVEMYVIFGINFGRVAGPSEGGISGPASTRGL